MKKSVIRMGWVAGLVAALSPLAQAQQLPPAPHQTREFFQEHCLVSLHGVKKGFSDSPAELFARYQAKASPKPLVIYFHGGLVSEASGRLEAETLSYYALKDDVCYPLYWLWDSALSQVLFRNEELDDEFDIASPSVPKPLSLTGRQKLVERAIAGPGRQLWRQIKQDIALAFKPGGVGQDFVKAAKSLHPMPRIVLIGHSAGALYVLKLIDELRKVLPETQYDVVFMAPACSYQYVADKLEDWHAHGYQPFRSFRMFGLKEGAEAADPVARAAFDTGWADRIYPASVLYLVSRLFENSRSSPLLGMQTYEEPSEDDPIDQDQHLVTRQYLLNPPGGVVWSPTEKGDGIGLQSQVEHHTDFESDSENTASLHEILKAFNADPIWSRNPVHVELGSSANGFQGVSYPTRHTVIQTSAGKAHVDFDRLTLLLYGVMQGVRFAYTEFEGPSSWLGSATTAHYKIGVRSQLTPGSQVTLLIDADGSTQVKTVSKNFEVVEFDAPIRPGSVYKFSVQILGERNSEEDRLATTLESMEVTAKGGQ